MEDGTNTQIAICNGLRKWQGRRRASRIESLRPSDVWGAAIADRRLRRLLGATCAACGQEVPSGEPLAHGRFDGSGVAMISYVSAPLCATCWAEHDYDPALVHGPVDHHIHQLKCGACGRTFYRRANPGLRFPACCESCAYQLRREAQAERRAQADAKPAEPYVCASCGDAFQARRSYRWSNNKPAYCSGACRQRAYRARSKKPSARSVHPVAARVGGDPGITT